MVDSGSGGQWIESSFGRECEGLLQEGRRLELWIDDAEVGEPMFRCFETSADDLLAAYCEHVARDGTDEVTDVCETSPGAEWVIGVSTYSGWYRAWAKVRDE